MFFARITIFGLLFLPPVLADFEDVLKEMSQTMSSRLEHGKTLAVVNLVNLRGTQTELGIFLAEELSILLVQTKAKFTVVDRFHLQTVMEEHQLTATGLVNPGTAKELGQLISVDYIVTGTLSEFGDTIRIALKAISVKTGAVISSASGKIAKTGAIVDMLDNIVSESNRNNLGTSTGKSNNSKPPKNLGGKEFSSSGNGLTVNLTKCSYKDGSLRVDFEVIAGNDANIKMYRGFAYNSSGSRYSAKERKIGSYFEKWPGVSMKYKLIRGAKTKGYHVFKVSNKPESLLKLELPIKNGYSHPKTYEFRNIPVE